MGFTVENINAGRYTIPLAYVCLYSMRTSRRYSGESSKYNTKAEFDIYHSQQEKESGQPIYRRIIVEMQSDDLPTAVEMFDLCQTQHFSGCVIENIY